MDSEVLVLQALPVVNFFSGFLGPHLETTALVLFPFPLYCTLCLTRFCPEIAFFFPTGIVELNFEAFWHHADFQDASSDSEFHAGPEVSRQHPRGVLTKGSDTRI